MPPQLETSAMLDHSKIWSSPQLPTLPTVAVRLLELSKDPEAEIRDVIDVIKTDPAISAKILKSTNSSFFGFKSQVTSIDRAVPLLGTTVVTSLALSFSLVEAAMTTGPLAVHYSAYWKQSIVQACAAETISECWAKGLSCEYFLAGLLADLGRLAMLKTIPKPYQEVLAAAENEPRDLAELETDMVGISHVDVGVKMMENWKLPAGLVQSVRLHHAPVPTVLEESQGEGGGLIRAVAISAAAGDYFCLANKGRALDRLQQLTGACCNFNADDLEQFLANTRTRMEQAGDLFAVNFDELGEPSEIMAQASEQLAQLALREHVASTQAAAQREAAERANQELESKNLQLQRQALHDPLTHVYNRHFFDEALNTAVYSASRSAEPLGLIFADIDRFKQINDTYGHPFGDLVLQKVAAVFVDAMRKSDVLARYGGEEFVILLRNTTEKGLLKVAERIRELIDAMEVVHCEQRVPVTISVGAAIGIPERNAESFGRQLVATADDAMYEAKQGGRNQVRLSSLVSDEERRLTQRALELRFSRWLVQQGYFDVPTVSQALLRCQTQRMRVGEIAQQLGYLTPVQINHIRQTQQRTGERFGQAAMKLGLITEDQFARLLALQCEDPSALCRSLISADLATPEIAATLLEKFQAEWPAAPAPAPEPLARV